MGDDIFFKSNHHHIDFDIRSWEIWLNEEQVFVTS
jgi:hypothetical protein